MLSGSSLGALRELVAVAGIECVHDVQMMGELNLEEILTLLVAFWEAMRSERRAKFSGVQVIQCANI